MNKSFYESFLDKNDINNLSVKDNKHIIALLNQTLLYLPDNTSLDGIYEVDAFCRMVENYPDAKEFFINKKANMLFEKSPSLKNLYHNQYQVANSIESVGNFQKFIEALFIKTNLSKESYYKYIIDNGAHKAMLWQLTPTHLHGNLTWEDDYSSKISSKLPEFSNHLLDSVTRNSIHDKEFGLVYRNFYDPEDQLKDPNYAAVADLVCEAYTNYMKRSDIASFLTPQYMGNIPEIATWAGFFLLEHRNKDTILDLKDRVIEELSGEDWDGRGYYNLPSISESMLSSLFESWSRLDSDALKKALSEKTFKNKKHIRRNIFAALIRTGYLDKDIIKLFSKEKSQDVISSFNNAFNDSCYLYEGDAEIYKSLSLLKPTQLYVKNIIPYSPIEALPYFSSHINGSEQDSKIFSIRMALGV